MDGSKRTSCSSNHDERTTLYYDPSLYEISYPDLTEFYPLKSQVPLSVVLENAIVYSDNSCANMMFVYYKNYADETFRQWFAHLSPTAVPDDFNYTNKATVGLMLNTMKKLYREQDKYQKIIENMKIASEGEYIKQNEYSFEVTQKYDLFEEYQHAMGLMETHQPILVGVFTTLYPEGTEVIADMSKIMAEYAIAND